MRNKFATFFVLFAGLAIFAGCVSPTTTVSPNPVAGQPPVTNTVYVPSPGISNAQQIAQAWTPLVQAAVAATPAAPAAPFLPTALAGIFAALTAVSSAYAAYKNNQVKTATNAAAALAVGVANNPIAESSAATAANLNGSTALVAQHIQNAKNPV